MNLQRIAKILENKNDLVINEVVLDKAQKDKQIIYGAKAYNSQSPSYLRKKTVDYDILTKSPKKSAKEVAEILARRTGRTTEVIKGTHKGTYRVKLDNEVVVDYTQMKFKPKTKRVWGNQYRSLKSIKRNAKRLSNNPKLEYRREKDLDTLRRVAEIERINAFDF
jgi:hypothetical protein